MPKRRQNNGQQRLKKLKREDMNCVFFGKEDIIWFHHMQNRICYKSWILGRNIVFDLHVSSPFHVDDILAQMQRLLQCDCCNQCTSSILLQKELQLLVQKGLGLIVHEQWNDYIQRTFAYGTPLFNMSARNTFNKQDVFDKLWEIFVKKDERETKMQEKRPKKASVYCLQEASYITNPLLTLSPFIYLDWNLEWILKTSHFFPYNLHDPIPIRDPILKLFAFDQQKCDLEQLSKKRESNVNDTDNTKEHKSALQSMLLQHVSRDTSNLILAYLPSNLISYLQDQVYDDIYGHSSWKFFPQYAILEDSNPYKTLYKLDNLRYMDIEKINTPKDILSYYKGSQKDLLSNDRKVSKLQPFTFCLELSISVPRLDWTLHGRWPDEYTLEEWLIWSTLSNIVSDSQRNLEQNIMDGIMVASHTDEHATWLRLYDMSKDVVTLEFLPLVEWFKDYICHLPKYEIQQVDETHAPFILPRFVECMKRLRRFPTSCMYDRKRAAFFSADISLSAISPSSSYYSQKISLTEGEPMLKPTLASLVDIL